LMSAPLSYKLDVQARCRYAKRCNNERNLRTTMTPVAEGVPEITPTASPDSYTGPVGKDFLGLSLDTPLSKQPDYDYSAHNAARALQALHDYPRSSSSNAGLKRSRAESVGQSLQENVREMLMSSTAPSSCRTGWSEKIIRDRKGSRASVLGESQNQIAMPSPSNSLLGRKRMCCEPMTYTQMSYTQPGCRPELVALPSVGAPGMWAGILN